MSSILHAFVELYSDNALQIEDSSNGPDRILQCSVLHSGLRGQPPYVILKVQLETLTELSYNYSTIGRMYGVSERFLEE